MATLPAAAGTLAGCDGRGGSPGGTKQPVKLVFLRAVGTDDIKLWENAVQRYRAVAPPHVEVDYATNRSGQEYWDKVLVMVSGGVPLDVVDQHSTRIVPWSAGGIVLDLTTVIRKSPLPRDVYPASNRLFSYKGKQYGIAWDIAMQGLYYNRTLLDGAGVKPPDESWTWETYLQAARQVTRGEGQSRVFGSLLLPLALQFLCGWFESNGGKLFDDARARCLVTDTPVVNTLQWIADLRVKHRVAPTPEEEAAQGDLYNNGRAALKVAGNFTALAPIRAAQAQGWTIGTAPVPRGSARRAGFLGGSSHAVVKASKAPDDAWELAKFMSLDEVRIKEFGSLGRTMSPRQSLEAYSIPQGIDGVAFKKSFVDTLETAAVTAPFTPNWPDIEKVFATELAPVWLGQKTAREAAASIKPQVEMLLSQLPRS